MIRMRGFLCIGVEEGVGPLGDTLPASPFKEKRLLLIWFQGARLHPELAAELGSVSHVLLALETGRMQEWKSCGVFLHIFGEQPEVGRVW